VSAASAEDLPLLAMPADIVRRAASLTADLTFPEDAQAADELTVPRMAFLKPPGEGPFAALVMMHQCAGVNPAIAEWARGATRRGYAVLLTDSLQQRGVRSVCNGPRGGVNLFRGAQDALQAATHLRKFPFIDNTRISFVGFSWGAMVGLIIASSSYRKALGDEKFRAVAAFYPGCFRIARSNGPTFDIVSADMLQPVLVLMGELDLETPAPECVSKLRAARATGAAVDWHVYEKAGHCWDCKQLDGFSKMDNRGVRIDYRYDVEVTRDSADRLFNFLASVSK
jgi:dienelactone hydrolase